MLERSEPITRAGSVWPHRLALLTAGATFPLLFVGGLVTSKGAGLAVPDWPTTFGYNMFLYPWSDMVGNIFYEHSHRLIASSVGILTIMLCAVLWLREARSWVRWLGTAALGLVIAQGVVGGLRVVLLAQTLAILHACLAQAFFALAVAVAVFTSGDWRSETEQQVGSPHAIRFRLLCVFTTALVYFQSVSGAVVRHTGSALDLHMLLALMVTLHVALVARRTWKFYRVQEKLRRPATILIALLGVQLALGVGSYLGKFSSFGALWPRAGVVAITTTHVVIGALLLATCLALTLRAFRFLAPPDPAEAAHFLSERAPA
jgi:cytochrome c oxidase assembly protein subunit 15